MQGFEDDSLFYSLSECLRFSGLLLLIDIEYSRLNVPLLSWPKSPPNFWMTASGMINPDIEDFNEQICLGGASIEMTVLLHDLL